MNNAPDCVFLSNRSILGDGALAHLLDGTSTDFFQAKWRKLTEMWKNLGPSEKKNMKELSSKQQWILWWIHHRKAAVHCMVVAPMVPPISKWQLQRQWPKMKTCLKSGGVCQKPIPQPYQDFEEVFYFVLSKWNQQTSPIWHLNQKMTKPARPLPCWDWDHWPREALDLRWIFNDCSTRIPPETP